jgi:hypothetical protein
MRKLLALFGAVGLVSMSAATVVSCNDVADLGYYADSIENNLRTENIIIVLDGASKGQSVKMSGYFNEAGEFDVRGPQDKDGNFNNANKLLIADFNSAVEMSIESVVGSKKDTDYTYSIKKSATVTDEKVDKTTLDYSSAVDSDEDLATANVAFDIHIEAGKDSTLWKGTADIYMLANWGGGQ